MVIENITFNNNKNQLLHGRIYKDNNKSKKGVIFSHGLFSSKDGYKITRLAEDIVKAGCTLMTFDFSFAWESGGEISDISILQETEDLKYAVDFFIEYGIKEIHLMGSSMGGAVSILYASQNNKKIISLITIAAPLDIPSIFKQDINDIDSIPEKGMTIIDGVSIKNSFFKEIKNIDIRSALKKINLPVLIFHGALDKVVSVENAHLFHSSLESYCEKIIINDGDHNLTRDSDLEIISKGISDWFTRDN